MHSKLMGKCNWAYCNLLILAFLILSATGCAQAVPLSDFSKHGEAEIAGLFSGIWHGLTVPFSFIGSLWSEEVAIYAAYNNGGWYDFGFCFGLFVLARTMLGSSSSTAENKAKALTDIPPDGQGDAAVATPRTIKTARTIEEINAAARDGFFPLVKLLEPSEVIRSKFSVLQNKTTGEIEVIGDYRAGCGDDFEIVIGFTYVYPTTFTSPFAAYLIPRDLVPDERVLLVDLIEDFVGDSWNQGDTYRLKACEAIWDGDDFDIQYAGPRPGFVG